MDSELGRALCQTSTSNQWALISNVFLQKISRKLGRPVGESSVVQFLNETESRELMEHGIWKEKAGSSWIICINPAFGRARREPSKAHTQCPCNKSTLQRATKYFNSTDYNGGRHACTASKHIGSCCHWRPPTSGHLHSWRRSYNDNKKP